MNANKRMVVNALTIFGLVLGLLAGAWTPVQAAPPEVARSGPDVEGVTTQDAPDAANAQSMILQYAAKFVCTAALPPGQFWYGLNAPIVHQTTDVLIHNPNAYGVTLYKKAVEAPIEDHSKVEQGMPPGKWVKASLGPDYAFRINCDDIAKLLTGKADSTFVGTYGIGKTVEGFVVIGIGPQPVAGTNIQRFSQLDVTADYVRGSEVMKKDIHYQPWWWWWWWPLPWRLGYAYQRILPIPISQTAYPNIDCREILYNHLKADVERAQDANPQQKNATTAALNAGMTLGPTTNAAPNNGAETAPALVALIGRCDKVVLQAGPHISVDYVLVSNKGPTDPNPITVTPAQASQVLYPWHPGRWYDLALVTPQNLDVDIQHYFLNWQTQRWISAGETAANAQAALVYYFPYWCGWGYWWWWWNSSDCIDIGVGEGESLDVEQIAPVRVFMPQWPPQ